MAMQVAEADFVIVGGGSAGCALAARLSADPSVTVILLEAGGRDRSPFIHLPLTYYKTKGPGFTWGYETAPQKHQGDIRTAYFQARVMGGGSSINAQIYIRGNPQDFDGWRDDHGCIGWGYDDVLPFFRRAEDNQSFVGKTHGTGGPLLVSNPAYVHPLTYAWLRACQQAGLPTNPDFNSGTQAGCGLYQVTNRAGRRSSTATAYLRPALKRRNLRVFPHATVRRLVFEGKRAAGVEADLGGGRQVVRARREVILTAGAIGTPKLLMLSGLGPAPHLKAHGIDVVQDVPEIGRNMQDHADIVLSYGVANAQSYDKYRKLHWKAWAALEFALFRSGPIASNGFEAGGFWWSGTQAGLPDIQFHFLPGSAVNTGLTDVPAGGGCTLNTYLLRPKSRGTITLASANMDDLPAIDPNFLAHPDDVAGAIAGVKVARAIMGQDALSRHLTGEHHPGMEEQSDTSLEAFVRASARTGYHPSGTCRMGADDGAVVDPQLRVRGIAGLRIADASIMPRLVSGNTNATTIMIAERAADMLLSACRA